MEIISVVAIVIAAVAITYGITAWAHRKNAPKAVVAAAAADIRMAEDKVETALGNVESQAAAQGETILQVVEEDVWKVAEAALAKAADLTGKKAAVDAAAAEYASAQKRVAEFKATVAALPQA